LLIDFGPPKVNPADLEIADFDPLVSKGSSLPTSPSRAVSRKGTKETTSANDRRGSAFSSNAVNRWEKFE